MTEAKVINVLLLGETGVGKTTFVNAIANYLSYGTLDEAMKGTLKVLAPTLISLVNDENDTVAIPVGSFPAGANLQVGSAGTSNVTSYDLVIDRTKLKLIDTPGIGDPKGVKEDDAHLEIILGYLRSLKEIHAICLVMRPNVNRNNVLFEYCLKRILAILDRGVSKNLIIVFTNTRSTFYSAPDTLVCLETILKGMKKNSPTTDIAFTDDNVFCLDNEAFKHLGASKHNLCLDGEALKNSSESWNVSWEECRRLIAYVGKMKPYQVRITVEVREVKKLHTDISENQKTNGPENLKSIKKLVDEYREVLLDVTIIMCRNTSIYTQLYNYFFDKTIELENFKIEFKRKYKLNDEDKMSEKAKIKEKERHLQKIKNDMNQKEKSKKEQRDKLDKYVRILPKYTTWLQVKSTSSFKDTFEESTRSFMNCCPDQLAKEITDHIIQVYYLDKNKEEKKRKTTNNEPMIAELKYNLKSLLEFKQFCQGASGKINANMKADEDHEQRRTDYKNQPQSAIGPSDHGNNLIASPAENVDGTSEKDQETKIVAQSQSMGETTTATEGISQICAPNPQESWAGPEGINGTSKVTPKTSSEESPKENASFETTDGMLKSCSSEPYDVKNTISINEARTLVSQLIQPLSEIVELIQVNICAMEVQQETLKVESQSKEQLKNEMFIPFVTLAVTELSQPVTVCTSLKCADAVKIGEVTKWDYRTRCHDPCHLTGVPREVVGDQLLLKCEAMGGQRSCQKCSCDYQVHMHVHYMTEIMSTKIVDQNKVNSINDQQNATEVCQSLIEQMNGRIGEYEQECDVITKCAAKFAHFLQQNAITPFNDAYKKYLEQLTLREKQMGQSANMELIKKLQNLVAQHTQIKKTFESNADNVMSSDHPLSKITPAKDIQPLFKLKHNGKKIREMYEKQNTCKKNELKTFEYVDEERGLKNLAQSEQEREDDEKAKVTSKNETKASEEEEKKTKAKSTDEDDGCRSPKKDQNWKIMPYQQHGAFPGFPQYPVMQPPFYGTPPNHFQNPNFYAPPHQQYQHMQSPHQQPSSNGPYYPFPPSNQQHAEYLTSFPIGSSNLQYQATYSQHQGQQAGHGVSHTPPPYSYQN